MEQSFETPAAPPHASNRPALDYIHAMLRHLAVDMRKLNLDPQNARHHDAENITGIKESLKKFGQRLPIVVRKADMTIYAGNGRYRAAKELGWTHIAAVVCDDSELDAVAFGIADNQSAATATWNEKQLAALLERVKLTIPEMPTLFGGLQSELEGLNLSFGTEPDASADAPLADGPDESGPQYTGIYALSEAATFDSDNEWGIPRLLPEKCATLIPTGTWCANNPLESQPEIPLCIFRTVAFPKEASRGVLAFYVEDHRFERVWQDAVAVVHDFQRAKWSALVGPDFSVWRDDPLPVQLWSIYRSRWVSRYWQEAGFPVIPSLNWSDERSHEFAHAGIPQNCPVVSVQCRTLGGRTASRKGQEFFLRGIAQAVERIQPQNVILYGGTQHRQWLDAHMPSGPAYHWLDSWVKARRRKGEKI